MGSVSIYRHFKATYESHIIMKSSKSLWKEGKRKCAKIISLMRSGGSSSPLNGGDVVSERRVGNSIVSVLQGSGLAYTVTVGAGGDWWLVVSMHGRVSIVFLFYCCCCRRCMSWYGLSTHSKCRVQASTLKDMKAVPVSGQGVSSTSHLTNSRWTSVGKLLNGTKRHNNWTKLVMRK